MKPHSIVNPAHPDGWAPIPTLTVSDALRLEALLRYVVPGRHGDQAVVDIYEGGPGQWGCNCDQAHVVGASDNLCDAVMQVAILRGDFVRRKER